MHSTATQCLAKPHNASASVARGCNCEFAANQLSCYIAETVRASAKMSSECEYKVSRSVEYSLVSFPMTLNFDPPPR